MKQKQKQKDVRLHGNYVNLGEYRKIARRMLRNPEFTYSNTRRVFSECGVLDDFYFRKGE